MDEIKLNKARLKLAKDFADGKITATEHLEELSILENNHENDLLEQESELDDYIEANLEEDF